MSKPTATCPRCQATVRLTVKGALWNHGYNNRMGGRVQNRCPMTGYEPTQVALLQSAVDHADEALKTAMHFAIEKGEERHMQALEDATRVKVAAKKAQRDYHAVDVDFAVDDANRARF